MLFCYVRQTSSEVARVAKRSDGAVCDFCNVTVQRIPVLILADELSIQLLLPASGTDLKPSLAHLKMSEPNRDCGESMEHTIA